MAAAGLRGRRGAGRRASAAVQGASVAGEGGNRVEE